MFKNKRTAMVEGLVLTVFLSLLILMVPGKALAAYECFMSIKVEGGGDIQGESTIRGKENMIEIISWSQGESLPTDPNSGLPAGKRKLQPIKFTMRTSKASLPLMQALNTGRHLTVILTVRKQATAPEKVGGDYLKFTLTGARVVSFTTLGNSGSTIAYPVEEVLLVYKKIVIQYRQPMSDGSLGPPVEVEWDWDAPVA